MHVTVYIGHVIYHCTGLDLKVQLERELKERRQRKYENIAWVAKSCPESWSVVKVLRCFFLQKDVIITTSVTTVNFITITIWVFELSQFYFLSFAQFEFLSLVTIWSFKSCHTLFLSFITVWVLEFGHNLGFYFSFVSLIFF